MFRALLALGLTAQAHAMSCATSDTSSITGNGHVCPEGSEAKVYRLFGNYYKCITDSSGSHPFVPGGCPTGWQMEFDGLYAAECKLTIPDDIKDNAVADCSVNMCPEGYVPHGGLCVNSCPDGLHLKENSCSPCQAGEVDYEGACVGPMGLVHTAEGWIPHTCTTISESYINSQCCQGC